MGRSAFASKVSPVGGCGFSWILNGPDAAPVRLVIRQVMSGKILNFVRPRGGEKLNRKRERKREREEEEV